MKPDSTASAWNALDGRIALVTGATGGIGRAIADGFLRAGAHVVVDGRSSERAQEALDDWKEYRERVQFIAADVSHSADCERLVDQSLAQFGGLDILVNNCGAMTPTGKPTEFVPIHEQPESLASVPGGAITGQCISVDGGVVLTT